MSDVLAAIAVLVAEETARPLDVGETVDMKQTVALLRIGHLIDAVASGQLPSSGEAITLSATAGPLDQLDALLRRQEWQRLPGAVGQLPGQRCPVCFNVRSRAHRAGCWLRQALILLQLARVLPPRLHLD